MKEETQKHRLAHTETIAAALEMSEHADYDREEIDDDVDHPDYKGQRPIERRESHNEDSGDSGSNRCK